jgi:hypothetical protein
MHKSSTLAAWKAEGQLETGFESRNNFGSDLCDKMVSILSCNLSCLSIFNDQSVYLLVTQERLPLLQIEIIGFNAQVMNSR